MCVEIELVLMLICLVLLHPTKLKQNWWWSYSGVLYVADVQGKCLAYWKFEVCSILAVSWAITSNLGTVDLVVDFYTSWECNLWPALAATVVQLSCLTPWPAAGSISTARGNFMTGEVTLQNAYTCLKIGRKSFWRYFTVKDSWKYF